MLGLLLRLTFATALLWCALVECTAAFARWFFDLDLDGDWIRLLASVETASLVELFRPYILPMLVTALVFCFFAVFIVRVATYAQGVTAVMFAAVACGYLGWSCRSLEHLRRFKPLSIVRDLVETGVRDEEAEIFATESSGTNYVFLIGGGLTPEQIKGVSTQVRMLRRRDYRLNLIEVEPSWCHRCGLEGMPFALFVHLPGVRIPNGFPIPEGTAQNTMAFDIISQNEN